MTLSIPEQVDWDIHRIASSKFYSSSLVEIETQWTICDVWDANRVLDVYDELDRRAKRNAAKGK